MKINIGDSQNEIKLLKKGKDELIFEFRGREFKANLCSNSKDNYSLVLNGKKLNVSISDFESKGQKQIFCNGFEEYIQIGPKAQGSASKGPAEGSLESPMPGKIFQILKKKGSEVKSGDTILILEAMKMEHAIKATKDGKVKEIFFNEGEQVTGGAELCAIE